MNLTAWYEKTHLYSYADRNTARSWVKRVHHSRHGADHPKHNNQTRVSLQMYFALRSDDSQLLDVVLAMMCI